MTTMYLAEKPELARAIAEAIGGKQTRGNGYITLDNGDVVSWCYGHILRLAEPEEYDEKYKKWSLDDLPIVNIPWKRMPIEDKAEQLKTIGKLLKQADTVVHAGDPDDEGQLLVDEVLEYFNYAGPTKRILINDISIGNVKKELQKLKPNADWLPLGKAAEARMVADQLVGYNLTRAYTLIAQSRGFDGVLSVGRVQTPVLGLVVRRDRENAGHKKAYYYTVIAALNFDGIKFTATYIPNEQYPLDEKKRLIDKEVAETIAAACTNQTAQILAAKTTDKKTPPPLPFNLLRLQSAAWQKFKYSPDKVKEITQSLRENHKLITYNRSDCSYLNDDQHADAPQVLEAIKLCTAGDAMETLATNATPSLKSRAFNSAKVSAHHAIIPTINEKNVVLGSLTDAEKNVYLLIAQAYVMQFYPDEKYKHTELIITNGNYQFKATGKKVIDSGWKANFTSTEEEEEEDEIVDLISLQSKSIGKFEQCQSKENETKPQPLYTYSTLLNDLTRVAKYIKDEKIRTILIEKDKDKAGEHGGIGTPATRDEIIKGLIEKGYIVEKSGKLISSIIGQKLYDALPDGVKFPDMTAVWFEQQQLIVEGKIDQHAFLKGITTFIQQEIDRVSSVGLNITSGQAYACPECGKALRKIRGKTGFFWGCTGYKDGCEFSCSDSPRGPVLNPNVQAAAKSKASQAAPLCPKCQSKLELRRNTQDESKFWACTNRPACKSFYKDFKGKPVFNNQ